MPKRKLRVFRFGCSAKWNARSWKTSEFDKGASEKTPRFSTRSFRFCCIVPNGKLGMKNLGKLILRDAVECSNMFLGAGNNPEGGRGGGGRGCKPPDF